MLKSWFSINFCQSNAKIACFASFLQIFTFCEIKLSALILKSSLFALLLGFMYNQIDQQYK